MKKKTLSILLIFSFLVQFPVYSWATNSQLDSIEEQFETQIDQNIPENININDVTVDLVKQEVSVEASVEDAEIKLNIELQDETDIVDKSNQLTMEINENNSKELYNVFFGSEEQKRIYDEAIQKDEQILAHIEENLSLDILNNDVSLNENDNFITENIPDDSSEYTSEFQKIIENDEKFVLTTPSELEESTIILTNIETNENMIIDDNDGVASWAFVIPAGIVLSKALISSLLYWGSAIVLGGVVGLSLSKLSTDSRTRNKKYSHFKIIKWNNKLFSTGGISQKSAVARMTSNGDVWSINQAKAKTVASSASLAKKGKKNPIGPERDANKKGYYRHYHTNPRKNSKGHSFYGGPS